MPGPPLPDPTPHHSFLHCPRLQSRRFTLDGPTPVLSHLPKGSQSMAPSHTLPALHHALSRLSVTKPRIISSPPTQPRRASVALILRIRPHADDEEYLSQQYDAEGLPLPGSEVDRLMAQSGLGLGGGTGLGGSTSGSVATSQRRSRSRRSSIASSSSRSGAAGKTSTQRTLSSFFSLPWVQRGVPEILYIKRATRATDKWSAHVAFPGGRRDETDEDALYTAMRETWEEVGLDLADRDFLKIGQLDDREITSSLGKRLLMVLSPFGESCAAGPNSSVRGMLTKTASHRFL